MKVYLVWYRDTEAHKTYLWGVYGTTEKAEAVKQEIEKIRLNFCAWVNDEAVQ